MSTPPVSQEESRWFTLFRTLLTPLIAHAQALGRSGIVMLYAAVEYLAAELREKSGLTEDEVKHAKAVADDARRS